MLRYTIRRLLWGLLVLFVITVVTFTLFGPVLQGPGNTDLAKAYAGCPCLPDRGREHAGVPQPGRAVRRPVRPLAQATFAGPSEEDKEKFCPPGENCSDYVGRLGNSFSRLQSVDKAIKDAFPATMSLVTIAAIIWLAVAIPVGVLSAIRTRSVFDRVAMVVVLWGQALPVYYFGLLALYFFAYLPNSQSLL